MATRDGKPSSLTAKFRIVSGICACLLAASAPGAGAATGNVVFSGTISAANLCVINVLNDGRFGVRADRRELSSTLTGGFAAVADITSFSNYQLTAIPLPTLTAYPTGGNTGVTLSSTFSGQSILNGRTFGDRPGQNQVRLRNGLGITRINVNMAATRATAFPSGYYQGTVVIRCE
jgi:type 1 fimbria pilin